MYSLFTDGNTVLLSWQKWKHQSCLWIYSRYTPVHIPCMPCLLGLMLAHGHIVSALAVCPAVGWALPRVCILPPETPVALPWSHLYPAIRCQLRFWSLLRASKLEIHINKPYHQTAWGKFQTPCLCPAQTLKGKLCLDGIFIVESNCCCPGCLSWRVTLD